MSKLSLMRALGVAAALAVLSVGAAHADVKAFNAAVKAGDYKTASTESEAIWKTWDTTDNQTAVLAREFGFAALVSGRNDLARQYGEFLVQKGATLKTPDDQPAISAVLFRIADFKVKSGDGERKALREALVARSATPGVDMTSVLSWEALYVGDWNKGDWEQAQKDAAAAAEYFKRQPAALLNRQRNAEVLGAAADFLANRSRITKGRNEYYDAMANVHDAVVADINATTSPSTRNKLFEAKWKSEAWALAIGSFLSSTYTQVGSNISTEVKMRPLLETKFGQFEEDPAEVQLPICEGKFEGRKMVYPGNQQFRGLVGSVIAHMETDSFGRVTKAEVLAAVPAESFSGYVIDTLKTWTFKPDPSVNKAGCRLNSRNRTFTVIFTIG